MVASVIKSLFAKNQTRVHLIPNLDAYERQLSTNNTILR